MALVGMILSAAMLLRWLAGERKDPAAGRAADAVERAVEAAFAGGARTPDLGGRARTAELTAAVVAHLKE